MTLFVAFLLAAQAPSTSPADAVRAFYGHIVAHHPLGIPAGEVKSILWPLLTTRLARRLDTLQACEDDYFRQHRAVPGADQLKPTIGWIEAGLFSGGDEAARPTEVAIARVEPAGVDRFLVHLQFTYRDTVEASGRPTDDSNAFRWPGIEIVAYEAGGYGIDDYLPIDRDSGKRLTALSKDFRECRGPRWIGQRDERH